MAVSFIGGGNRRGVPGENHRPAASHLNLSPLISSNNNNLIRLLIYFSELLFKRIYNLSTNVNYQCHNFFMIL
jgi:hypothetical protein